METETQIKPDIRILKLDETGYYSDEKLIADCGGGIFGVYMYDANRHVHCWEITPSYELYFIESQPFGLPMDDEEEIERIEEELRECDANTPPVSYYHVHNIDRIKEVEEGKSSNSSHRFKLSHLEGHDWGGNEFADGEETTAEQRHDSAIEDAMEWVRSNSV